MRKFSLQYSSMILLHTFIYLLISVFILLSRESDNALYEVANGSLHKLIPSRDGSLHNCIFEKTFYAYFLNILCGYVAEL